uniref:RT_RNaseH_2 domain-containing protein n=1 Tax=Hymenolepis diminuta TaxID=6216 RepID=A0A0R3SMW7_HYMDI
LQSICYSKWAPQIVVVREQNGSVRLCADFPTGLSAAPSSHHPLPVAEDIFATLNDDKCFAKLDLSEAYPQVEVEPECCKYLTINTHQNDTVWHWSADSQRAFVKLKLMLQSGMLLTHYNSELVIIIAAGASSYGVGAVILHVFPDDLEKSVIHASCSPTPTEKKCEQIEKEAPALVMR